MPDAYSQQDIMDMSVEIVAFGAILVFAAILVGLRCLDRERKKTDTQNTEYSGYQVLNERDEAELPHPSKRDSWRLYSLAVHGASK